MTWKSLHIGYQLGFLFFPGSSTHPSSKGNTGAKIRYASFLFVTKDYKEALKEIEAIYAIDTTRNLLNRLGAYASFELKEYDKGLSFMRTYMARQPEAKVLASDFAYYGKLLAATGQDSLAIEQLQLALKKDTTDAELLSELASTYAKTKDFNNCVATYQKKIELKKATTNDYYRMGQAYYQMQDFGKADTAFMRVTEIQPKLIVGYLWRARANSSLDPDSKEGLAKPFYDQVVQVGEEDSTKFSKELLEAYKYLGFYYYISKDYENSRVNWEKVKGIEPTNTQALDALKDLKSK